MSRNRRALLALLCWPGALLSSSAARPDAASAALDHLRLAEEVNTRASGLSTLNDSTDLVSMFAVVFHDELPRAGRFRAMRERIAKAEFASIHEPGRAISEQHLADSWNDYVRTIGAPQEALVSQAEIHELRSSLHFTATFFWRHGNRSIWTTPAIYATTPGGALAPGCRAIESLRLIWDLNNQFGNLQTSRESLAAGTPHSKALQEIGLHEGPLRGAVTAGFRPPDIIQIARQSYVRQHGNSALQDALEKMVNSAISSAPSTRS